MSSWLDRHAVLALACAFAACSASAQAVYPGIGRVATAPEIRAWDIDVRADLKGLPKGSGSVARGQVVWEGQCASCHGVFGEANHVFAPLVGGTTADDVKTGHAARLTDSAYPGRTTLMKLTSVSTLWDYINRAMPWNAPKSLSAEEVYAVTAYLLNLGGVVPDDFVLSDTTMADAQRRLPNRHGGTTDHGLWPGSGLGKRGAPDVKAVACMQRCAPEPQVVSQLPDFARNQHGNLADQQRLVGPQRGAVTAEPPVSAAPPVQAALAPPAVWAALQKNNCTACHGIDKPLVGPRLRDVASRYSKRADAQSYLSDKIRSGSQGVWGMATMPPQHAPDADVQLIAQWLATGAP